MLSNNIEEGHFKSIDTMIGNVNCPINDIVVEFELNVVVIFVDLHLIRNRKTIKRGLILNVKS
jgi:hypothetical protein